MALRILTLSFLAPHALQFHSFVLLYVLVFCFRSLCVCCFLFSVFYTSLHFVNCVIDGFLMTIALAKNVEFLSLLSLLFFWFLCYPFNKFGRHLQGQIVANSSPKFQNKPKEIMAAARKFSQKNRRILS